MKTIFYCIAFLFIINATFGQSNLILPQAANTTTPGDILKTGNGQGYSHTNGSISLGTSIFATQAFIQTHTANSLNFTVNNGNSLMTLLYSTTPSLNGNVGIGTISPTEKLHVIGNIRSSNLAGNGSRNVYTDANGVLTTTAYTRTLIVTPQSFQRRYNNGSGSFTNSGVYIDCYMLGSGATDNLSSSFTLPVGAIITGISVYFTDNDPNNNLQIIIFKSSVTNPGALNTIATLFKNTTNVNPYDITTLSSPTLNDTVNDGDFYNIIVAPAGATSNSAGVWNYNGGNSNFMSIKGLKITYLL